MLAQFVAAILALALLTVLPGPDVAVVTRVALSQGRRAALRAASGIVSGLLMWGALTVIGLASLLAASPTAYRLVTYAGAAYLVWLGACSLWAARRPDLSTTVNHGSRTGRGERTPFRTGLVSNLLNPKIAVFYTGLLPNLVPAQAPHTVSLAGLVLVHTVLSITWLALYAHLLDRIGTFLQGPRVRRTLDTVTGVTLVGFGVRVALSGSH